MPVPGHQVINLLLAELGLPAGLNVTSMTVRATVRGPTTVTLECLAPKAEGGELRRAMAERRWVMAEDTAGAIPPAGGPRRREFDHGYAVVRVDEYQGADCPEEDKVTVKEVARDEAAARCEVKRLNGLGKKGVRYFWQATRVERPAGGDDTAVADRPEGT